MNPFIPCRASRLLLNDLNQVAAEIAGAPNAKQPRAIQNSFFQ
jgi:hypothetical protein